jgi:hypothetical protein
MSDQCLKPNCKRPRFMEGSWNSYCLEHTVADLASEVSALRSKLNGGTVTLRLDMDVPEPE